MDFIPLDTLGHIIMKARKFDAGVAPEELEEASNATDDGGVAILEDTPDNPTQQELVAALRSLNDDQVAELLALVWLGRGDFDKDTWGEALAQAQVTRNGERYAISSAPHCLAISLRKVSHNSAGRCRSGDDHELKLRPPTH
jgi:hypothetical protein